MTTSGSGGLVPATASPADRLHDLLDGRTALWASRVAKHVARARRRNPDATPAEVVRTLEWMYVRSMAGAGAAVGAAAAAPGSPATAGRALQAGSARPIEQGLLLVFSIAHVHGVSVDEVDRGLIAGIVFIGMGSATFPRVVERTGKHWARHLVARVPAEKTRRINDVLGKNFVTKYGNKQGIVVLGEVAPYGVGAAIGASLSTGIAALTVGAARRAFGPAPASFAR